MRRLLLSLVLGAVTGPLAAQVPSDTVARWQRTLAETQELVQQHGWARAYQTADPFVKELLRDLKGGAAGAELLAAAYTQRALAEAGLGYENRAAWTFAIAQNLNPSFRDAPLERFGAAGEMLDRHRLTFIHQGAIDLDTPRLLAPLIVESPTMVFMAAEEVLEEFDLTMTVDLVVDTEGHPRQPLVWGSLDNPSPVALSLEVLYGWRFEPASLDGELVPVRIPLDLPLTSGAAERARAGLEQLRAAQQP